MTEIPFIALCVAKQRPQNQVFMSTVLPTVGFLGPMFHGTPPRTLRPTVGNAAGFVDRFSERSPVNSIVRLTDFWCQVVPEAENWR